MIAKDQWNFQQFHNLKCLSITCRSLKIGFQLARMQLSIVLLLVGFFLQRLNELINFKSWLHLLPNATQRQGKILGGCGCDQGGREPRSTLCHQYRVMEDLTCWDRCQFSSHHALHNMLFSRPNSKLIWPAINRGRGLVAWVYMRLVTLGPVRYMQHSVLASDSPTGVSLSTLHTSHIPRYLSRPSWETFKHGSSTFYNCTLYSSKVPAQCIVLVACVMLRLVEWANEASLLRYNESKYPFVYVCVFAIATKGFNRFQQNFAHRVFGRKSRSSSLMGNIALNISKRRLF